MKKGIVLALVLGLVAAMMVAPVEAKKKKKKPKRIERVVEFEYMCPCTGNYQLGSATGGDPNFGGGPLQPGAGEVYVSIQAEDNSGTPVLVSINQDTNGDGFNDGVADVCAPSDEPSEAAQINEGLEMRLFITFDPAGCGSVPLGGTLTITLSNMP